MAVHVLLVPWPSQGHLTPILQLGQLLASKPCFIITLALSARSSARMKAASSSLLPQRPNFKTRILRDGLNPDPSFTPSMDDVVASLPVLQQSLEELLKELMASSHPVTCLISSTFSYWTKSIAHAFDIPRIELWSSPAYVYSICFFHHHLVSHGLVPLKGQPHETWITCIPGLPPIRASEFTKESLPTEEEVQADPERLPRLLKRLKDIYGSAKDQYRILINSIYELESQSFASLHEEHVHACAVGPLFLLNMKANEAGQSLAQPRTIFYKEDYSCMQWLASRAPASTLYVAFGSEARMEKQDITELAFGLESSGHDFLWVIRPGSIVGDLSAADNLPEGFKERTAAKGLIVKWAPQMEVLSHPAIWGFLSHCGWNSTLEALWMGIPILGWPQRADQGVNQFFIRDVWKVGTAIEKNENGKVTRMAVKRAVQFLMDPEKSSHVREKVKEVKKLMDRNTSSTNLEQFIQDLYILAKEKHGM